MELKVKKIQPRYYTVIVQKWIESERGWGQRPDGCSLHRSEKDRQDFCEHYWSQMPDKPPDEYSKEAGQPFIVEVTFDVFKELKTSKNGIWVSEHRLAKLKDRKSLLGL